MGNCCEAVDSKIEEMLNESVVDSRTSTVCHSRNPSSSSTDKSVPDIKIEELRAKLKKIRLVRFQLNTIVEDKQEDLCSPFILQRLA